MASSNLIRGGGIAALIGGVLYVLMGIMSLFASQEEVFDSFIDYLIEVLFVLALVGTLVAIVGLHVLQKERYGRLGAAGFLTAFVGYVLLLVAATTILTGREALDIIFLLGSLVALVGLTLLGAMTLRARVLPKWCGVLLIVGLPLTVFLDIVTGGGAGGILLGVVWALVGYALLATRGGTPAQQPSRVS